MSQSWCHEAAQWLVVRPPCTRLCWQTLPGKFYLRLLEFKVDLFSTSENRRLPFPSPFFSIPFNFRNRHFFSRPEQRESFSLISLQFQAAPGSNAIKVVVSLLFHVSSLFLSPKKSSGCFSGILLTAPGSQSSVSSPPEILKPLHLGTFS